MRSRMGERWSVLAVIGLGGALGSLLRYGAASWLPHAEGEFPWSTLLVNAVGCAAIGAFMAVIMEVAVAHRLLRPFVGVGVLGGLTTFSTYAVDVVQLVLAGRPRLALAYLFGTVAAALAAVVLGLVGTRAALRRRPWRTRRRPRWRPWRPRWRLRFTWVRRAEGERQ